mmetsp:Transcript_15328/g.29564  ORF Transcript_15328/g.29564 Transcript_15328/m.29564 type:complete len:231 (-) Transcript_15328:452-1144(-)
MCEKGNHSHVRRRQTVTLVTCTWYLRAFTRVTRGISSSCTSSKQGPIAAVSPGRDHRSWSSLEWLPPSQRSCGVRRASQSNVEATATNPPRRTTPCLPPSRPKHAMGLMRCSSRLDTTTRSNSPRAGLRHMASICLNATRRRSMAGSTFTLTIEPNSPSSWRNTCMDPLALRLLAASTRCALCSSPSTSGHCLASSKQLPPTAHPTSRARAVGTFSFAAAAISRAATLLG